MGCDEAPFDCAGSPLVGARVSTVTGEDRTCPSTTIAAIFGSFPLLVASTCSLPSRPRYAWAKTAGSVALRVGTLPVAPVTVVS